MNGSPCGFPGTAREVSGPIGGRVPVSEISVGTWPGLDLDGRQLVHEPGEGRAVGEDGEPEDRAEGLLDRLVPEDVSRDERPRPATQEVDRVERGLRRTPFATDRCRRLVRAVHREGDAAEQEV